MWVDPMIRLIFMGSAFSCWWNAGAGADPKALAGTQPHGMPLLGDCLAIYSKAHRN